jgi:hypothetical protein
VQKEVQRIQSQAAQAGKSRDVLEKEREKAMREKEKAEEEKRRKEEAALFKPAQTQKVPFGVDPKTVLCAFFKAGNCEKGNKCKFSHNRDVERKIEKKNLYEDARDDKLEGAPVLFQGRDCGVDLRYADTMDKWDEEKLRNVVLSKHGNPKTTTDVRSLDSPAVCTPHDIIHRSCASSSSRQLRARSAFLAVSLSLG